MSAEMDVWEAFGGRGPYAYFILQDTVEITDAIYAPEAKFVKLDPTQDLTKQVIELGLSMDGTGNGSTRSDAAASSAKIFTLSSHKEEPSSDDDIIFTHIPGTILFSHVVPREEVFIIEDPRGEPKKSDHLDKKWVCVTRSGVAFHIMTTDTVIAPVIEGADIAGKRIYEEGKVSPEWLELLKTIWPTRENPRGWQERTDAQSPHR